MRKETLFEMTSPCRDSFRITGYRFGEGRKSLAIVGSIRGDEMQQQYICSQLIARFMEFEQRGEISNDHSILIIPSCNPFSMNVGRRFWTMDNTDINRMFPGYSEGETTQRIAAAIFSAITDFDYGIQLASYYVPGDFVPHVRILKTGYEDTQTARLFGMRYVSIYQPRPFDTGLLNYNWQLWNTHAFSVYAGKTNSIDAVAADETITAILRMMKQKQMIRQRIMEAAFDSVIFDEAWLTPITAERAGLFVRTVEPGQRVHRGDELARIIDAYEGGVLSEVKASKDGIVFFAYNRPFVLQHTLLFRIV